MEISGKTAIVTGAASGIGLGIATALAEGGANVVMADGSVHFLKDTTSTQAIWSLGSRAQGEVLSGDSY